jgi:hypothetical protein
MDLPWLDEHAPWLAPIGEMGLESVPVGLATGAVSGSVMFGVVGLSR